MLNTIFEKEFKGSNDCIITKKTKISGKTKSN